MTARTGAGAGAQIRTGRASADERAGGRAWSGPGARGLAALALATTLAGATGCAREPETGRLGRLAWTRGDSLFVQALPSGTPRLLGIARDIRRVRWSATGRWLGLQAADGLRLVRTDGTGGQKLAGPEAVAFAWSPVDDRIAYVAGGNLIVARAGGLGVVLFEKTAGNAATRLAWSADGSRIAFGVRDSSGDRAMVIPARGGEPAPAATSDTAPAIRPIADRRHELVVRPAGASASLRLKTDAEEREIVLLRRASTASADSSDTPWRELFDYWPGPPSRAAR